MGKSKNLRVIYDDPTGVFFAGQALRGKVVLDLKERMKIRALKIRFLGRAEVLWQDELSKLNVGNSVARGNEIYFDNTQALVSQETGSKNSKPSVLSAQQHEFRFEFILPPHLPSSFEDKFGCVRYEIFVIVDRIWHFDMNYKSAFSVIGIVDLNTEHLALIPAQNQGSIGLTICCIPTGAISCTIKIPRSGYVPGEEIPLTVEIFNQTGAATRKVRAFLRQVVTFYANNITKKVTKNVVEVKKSKVPSGDCQLWNEEKMHIPPVPPSRLDGCRLIDIYYEVMVCVSPSGFMNDTKEVVVSLPVIIGTIPLQSVVSTWSLENGYNTPFVIPDAVAINPCAGQNFVVPSAPVMPTAPSLSEMYPDMPPPAYEDCYFGGSSIRSQEEEETIMDNSVYTPKYTYYTLRNH